MQDPHYLEQTWRYIADHPGVFITALKTHALMSGLSVVLAIGIALPLGWGCARTPLLSVVSTRFFNTLRVIPGLAILALLIPILGTGLGPSVFALFILAFPTLLLNTMAGFQQIPEETREAARGLGLSPSEVFWKVDLPLATPNIMNGLRTSAVEVISGATLTAFIGGGGLGTFIVNGLSMDNVPLLMVGALPVALMAIAVEIFFNGLNQHFFRYQTC